MDIGYLFAISNLGYLLPYRTELTHHIHLYNLLLIEILAYNTNQNGPH